jgi:hypothetical protein
MAPHSAKAPNPLKGAYFTLDVFDNDEAICPVWSPNPAFAIATADRPAFAIATADRPAFAIATADRPAFAIATADRPACAPLRLTGPLKGLVLLEG